MAGFRRNGLRSSPEALAKADRHRQWIKFRRDGLLKSEIAAEYGETQQAISKAILKYVREMLTREARFLRCVLLAQNCCYA
jgi:hypothetical protein